MELSQSPKAAVSRSKKSRDDAVSTALPGPARYSANSGGSGSLTTAASAAFSWLSRILSPAGIAFCAYACRAWWASAAARAT